MSLLNRSMQSLATVRSWLTRKLNPIPNKINLGLLRISPVDTPVRLKEQFIPLTRTTLVRKLSQDSKYVSKTNEVHFEHLCRYLDACIHNRHGSLLQQLQAAYEHLNPDVELIIGGHTFVSFQRQILDDEFGLIQKLSRLLQLANFVEMNKDQLERWLKRHGSASMIQAWVEPEQYELLKVWLLGRHYSTGDKGVLRNLLGKYWPLQTRVSPFRDGDVFKRVVIAVRMKKSDKVALKMFKNLSEGELIHILPKMNISNSHFDNTVLLWTAGLCATGIGTHLLLPAATITSSWLLTSSLQLATLLASMSAAVGLLQWHVIQQKKSHYWQWRSELNYLSIMANNRGVIALLADRAHEEIFKEAVLSYVTLLRHREGGEGVEVAGISQSQLEAEVDGWAEINCDGNEEGGGVGRQDRGDIDLGVKIDLSECLALLRQLNLVTYDGDTHTLRAIPLQSAVNLLGSEFLANNSTIVDTDGTLVQVGGTSGRDISGGPPVEGFERLRGSIGEGEDHHAPGRQR